MHLMNTFFFFSVEFSVPLSSLGLLVPPLRLMSAVMWEVVRQRNIKHYEKLEEFVSMVTDAVPELMSKREGRLLSLGLRARVRESDRYTLMLRFVSPWSRLCFLREANHVPVKIESVFLNQSSAIHVRTIEACMR